MITATLLSLLAVASPPAGCLGPTACSVPLGSQDDEVEAKIRAVGDDVVALLALAEACRKAPEAAAATRVFERIIELEPDHEAARRALRHQRYDGRWFETYVELSRFKREETARMKEKGLARWEDRWVQEADLPFVRMGFVQHEGPGWVHPADLAVAGEVEEWKAAGYQFRADDGSWIAPDDFDKWSRLLWKCGEDWLDTEAADTFHANRANPWKLTGAHFDVFTTCQWSYGNTARWHADRTYKDLVRLFGVAPETRPSVLVLNSLDQYNVASAGPMIDSGGLSSLHGAYYCDGAVDSRQEPARFGGTGVSYWPSGDPEVAGWGPFWVRWAAAQSFVDAIDPSWVAVSAYVAGGGQGGLQAYGTAFWSEKSLPRWLRYGAASYVERYLANPEAAGDEDPWNLRDFALGDLKKSGGLRELSEVFAFQLTLEDQPGSTRLYSEAGLLVAFLLDGSADDAELRAKHEALRSALAAGASHDVRAASKALEEALAARTEAIRAFAGL